MDLKQNKMVIGIAVLFVSALIAAFIWLYAFFFSDVIRVTVGSAPAGFWSANPFFLFMPAFFIALMGGRRLFRYFRRTGSQTIAHEWPKDRARPSESQLRRTKYIVVASFSLIPQMFTFPAILFAVLTPSRGLSIIGWAIAFAFYVLWGMDLVDLLDQTEVSAGLEKKWMQPRIPNNPPAD